MSCAPASVGEGVLSSRQKEALMISGIRGARTAVVRSGARAIVLGVALTVLGGCSSLPKLPKLKMPKIPRIHKITVQQGNVITQDMIDQLKPGMTKRQVAFVMGEPVVRNPFDEDRWDYVYTIKIPRTDLIQQKMSLYFTNDLLTHFTGDLIPSEADTDDVEEAEPDSEDENSSATTGAEGT